MVKARDVIVQYCDYFSDPLGEVKAILDGHVTVIRTSPNVAPGNVVIEMDRIVNEDVEIIGTGS